jgi:hypothetical protein
VVVVAEFRAFVTVPGIPVDDEDAGTALMAHLEREHARFGPIIGWENGVASLTLSMEAEDPAQAAGALTNVVVGALRSAGLGRLHPTSIEVEPIEDALPVAPAKS